jgi:hypothetical protein
MEKDNISVDEVKDVCFHFRSHPWRIFTGSHFLPVSELVFYWCWFKCDGWTTSGRGADENGSSQNIWDRLTFQLNSRFVSPFSSCIHDECLFSASPFVFSFVVLIWARFTVFHCYDCNNKIRSGRASAQATTLGCVIKLKSKVLSWEIHFAPSPWDCEL